MSDTTDMVPERAQHDREPVPGFNASSDRGSHEVGSAQPGAQRISNVEAVRMALHDAMLADERVLVMGEDVARVAQDFLAPLCLVHGKDRGN